MRDTLDAHDAALVERVGFDQACREALAFLLDWDPVDCLHLAFDPAGEVVGMVSGLVQTSGRASVNFVGVPFAARGHGYGRELLAWQTRQLLAEGATELIADTDNANVPMVRAFAGDSTMTNLCATDADSLSLWRVGRSAPALGLYGRSR